MAPKIINAVLWTGDNSAQIADWLEVGDIIEPEVTVTVDSGAMSIHMPSGSEVMAVGDYIVLDIEGNFYPHTPAPGVSEMSGVGQVLHLRSVLSD